MRRDQISYLRVVDAAAEGPKDEDASALRAGAGSLRGLGTFIRIGENDRGNGVDELDNLLVGVGGS